MPSQIPSVQVRFSDPKVTLYLNALSKAGASKSKIVEELSAAPIRDAFNRWVLQRRHEGATYSQIFEEAGVPVPELMAIAEAAAAPDEAEREAHLRLIEKQFGGALAERWAATVVYPLESA